MLRGNSEDTPVQGIEEAQNETRVSERGDRLMRHREVRNLLYDYLQTEIDPLLKEDIERHLAHCEGCTRDLGAVKTILNALPQETDGKELAMEQSDWDALHASIMRRVQRAVEQPRRYPWTERASGLRAALSRPRYAIAAGVAIALLGLLWFLRTPVADHAPAPREMVQAPVQDPVELGRYFRKSRALLTGLSNLEPPAGAPIDLSVERKVSRELMIEGRSLRGLKLDQRSDRLIGELDKIMQQVSSAPEGVRTPDIQVIRNDIRGQNLLVKLRVAETSYAGSPHPGRGEGL